MKIPVLEPGNLGKEPQVPDMSAGRWALRQAGEGMNRVGQGLMDIGKGLEAIAQEKKKISQATQLGENRVNFENEWINAKTEFDKTNPDPDTYYQEGSKLFDKTLEKSLKQIKDSGVRDRFKIMMSEHKVTVLDSLSREAGQRWKDYNIAGLDKRVEASEQLISRFNDPVYANTEKESLRGQIRAIAPKLMGANQAGDYERAVMRRIEVTAVKTREIYDPVGLLQALERGEYPDIHPTDRPTFIKDTKAIIKSKETEDDNKKIDLIVRGLTKDLGNDFDTIGKRLDSFDYMEQKFGKDNVSTHIIAGVRNDIRSRQISDEQIKKGKSDAVFRDTWLNLDKTSISEIKRRVDKEGLAVHLGDALIKEKLNPPDIPINPAAYNRALGVVYDDTISRDAKTQVVLASPIPRTEKIGLLGQTYREEDKVGDHITRTGLDIIKSQLGPKSDMLGKMLPFSEEESKGFYYANITFEKAILDAKKAKKPLTSQEAVDKAFEIAHSAKLSLVQKAKTRSRELTGQGRALIEGTKKVEPKKPSETIEEYMKRVHPVVSP